FIIVFYRKNMRKLFNEIKQQPREWFIWSFVGFGLFYGPICIAAAYSPGWLIAGTWQITIISWALLSSLFFESIHMYDGSIAIPGIVPWRSLTMSLSILLGIFLMQSEHA